jgi:hypothetical protein
MLEELLLTGGGKLSITGGGPLSFAHDGAGELLLRLAADANDLNVVLGAPIGWSTSDSLRADVPTQGSLTLSGTIGAAGDLVKTGVGNLRLSGANSA